MESKRQVKNGYQMDMVHGPLAGKILLFALPLMFSSILQLLFNAADVVVVGRYAGEAALALGVLIVKMTLVSTAA